METNQIVFRRWEDLVFENRNKLYGAYRLRKTYANHLLSGLSITVLVASVILFWHAGRENNVIAERVLPPLYDSGIIYVLPPPPPFAPRTPLPAARPRGTRASGPVVVTQDEVEEVAEFVPVVDFASGDSVGTGDIVPIEGAGIFEIPQPAPSIAPEVLDIAEVMPQYEGGMEAMMKFIQKKIRYPRVPRQLGIEGTVFVSFIVKGDGAVADVRVIRGVHPDYDEEAARVISMLSMWKGGRHNGRPVSVKMVLPIKFNLQR